MISIFTTTKEFIDNYEIIQINALQSWRSISNEIEIIIIGDSFGSKQASKMVGAKFIPSIKCSENGTPLLSDLFQKAEKIAKHSILAYINADIILPMNFLESVRMVSKYFNKFLMVGHRWDMDVNDLINFNNISEQEKFWTEVQKSSVKHPCTGIDYFVYKKKQWRHIPEFIIGRPGFDNWLIWKARRRFYPIVDATKNLKVVHQNHHIHSLYEQEGKINKKIHKGKTLNLLDCTYKISSNKIIQNNDKNYKERYLYRLPVIFPEFSIVIKLYRRIYNFFKIN